MAKTLGNNYYIKPGESIAMSWTVSELAGKNGNAAFWLSKGDAITKLSPTVANGAVACTIPEETTLLMSGINRYECRVKNEDGVVVHVREGIIEVDAEALIDEALATPEPLPPPEPEPDPET